MQVEEHIKHSTVFALHAPMPPLLSLNNELRREKRGELRGRMARNKRRARLGSAVMHQNVAIVVGAQWSVVREKTAIDDRAEVDSNYMTVHV